MVSTPKIYLGYRKAPGAEVLGGSYVWYEGLERADLRDNSSVVVHELGVATGVARGPEWMREGEEEGKQRWGGTRGRASAASVSRAHVYVRSPPLATPEDNHFWAHLHSTMPVTGTPAKPPVSRMKAATSRTHASPGLIPCRKLRLGSPDTSLPLSFGIMVLEGE